MTAKHQSGFLAPDDPPSPKYTGKTGDKTIRFKLYWKHPGRADKDAMAETHEQITTDPEQWCEDIIAWFNSTLRPHETKREFVRCEVIGEVPPAEHRWVKHSAMTKIMVGGPRSGSNYDSMECGRCGVTGKRYGLKEYVKLDSKWRKAAFKRCDTSMKELGKWDGGREIS
jgi:hypothetical protein